MLHISRTEGLENSSDLRRISECKIGIVTETDTSPSGKLTALQVLVAREQTPKEHEETIVKSTSIVSQECLLSSSDIGSGGLEKFLRDKN